VQRASGIPCSLVLSRENETQTSGVWRRENADVYLVFENRIESRAVTHQFAITVRMMRYLLNVIAGLDPAIHVLLNFFQRIDMDGRVIGERKRRRPSDGYARP